MKNAFRDAMEWAYKHRWIAEKMRQAIEFSPVTVLSGARQTGKSTLLKHEVPFKDWPYFTLDDPDVHEMADKNPDELVAIHPRMIIDEVQKSPRLLSTIKKYVDRDRDLRFVLSGSANLLLMKNITETLAGRCIYFELLPFASGEYLSKPFPQWFKKLPPDMVLDSGNPMTVKETDLFRGFLPPVMFLDKESHIADWWNGYIKTYLERDLRDLSQISSIPDFRRMMTLIAAQSAQILNQSGISRSAGISQPTVNRYINLLEISGLFMKLKPYSKNIKKRIVKSPKAYFLDTGLICSLTGIKQAAMIDANIKGRLFETWVFHNLSVIASVLGGELFYLRKQGGLEREIDFIFEIDGKIYPIEVKASEKVTLKDAENMELLKDTLPHWETGLVIYNGTTLQKLRKDVIAVPAGML
jgi:predicted AAA+ superfamily ATPase